MLRWVCVTAAIFVAICVLPGGQGRSESQGQGSRSLGRRSQTGCRQGRGSQAENQADACRTGVNLTSVPGSITFRGTALGNYSINDRVLCKWRLPANALARISLQFTVFTVGINKSKSFCKNTTVRIHDGARWMDFCGSLPPTSAYKCSPGSTAIVEYRGLITAQQQPGIYFTLKYFNAGGFSVSRRSSRLSMLSTYSIQSCVSNDKITLTDSNPSVTIQVQGYEYMNNCDKMWQIMAPQYKAIRVQASGYIEYEQMCRYDQLSLYSTFSECPTGIIEREVDKACHRFGCLCGQLDDAFTHESLCNRLTVRFQSDGTVTGPGFIVNLTLADNVGYSGADTTDTCVLEDIKCGTTHANISSRITGGQEALKHQFPWQVLLEYHNSLICGGSIISNRWILTAAHCVINVLGPSLLCVRLGKHLRNAVEPLEQVLSVEQIIVHCNYDKKTFDNDIALLKLNEEIEFTNAVHPICLPNDHDAPASTECRIAGWGYTKEGDTTTTSNALRYGEVKMQTNQECKGKMAAYNSTVTDNMVCALSLKEENGDDACNGDSGGPLMLKVDPNKQSVQYGITSWGIGCSRQGLPGIYTRVHRYINWILSITKDCVYIHDPELNVEHRMP